MSKAPNLIFAEWCEEEEKDWVELMDKIDKLRDQLEEALDRGKVADEKQYWDLDFSLAALAMRCANYCDDARFVMITEMYRQNPMLKMLYESKLPPGTTPFTAPLSSGKPDDRPDNAERVNKQRT